jgi:hypothetical protein
VGPNEGLHFGEELAVVGAHLAEKGAPLVFGTVQHVEEYGLYPSPPIGVPRVLTHATTPG